MASCGSPPAAPERGRPGRGDPAGTSPASLRPSPSKIERDAAIQRFEYSFEAAWKAAQRFLALVEGIEAGAPKSVIRACQQAGLLSVEDTERALVMADDRNLTAHTHNEPLAEAIFARLPGHLATLEVWLKALQAKVI